MTIRALYFAAECKPFSKAGGVADVAGELPIELNKQGVDVDVITPMYGCIPKEELAGIRKIAEYNIEYNGKDEKVELFEKEQKGTRVILVKNETYFEGPRYSKVYVDTREPDPPFWDDSKRFAFFSEAAIRYMQGKGSSKAPEYSIIHGNDWPTGFLFARMKMEGMEQKKILTIHNIGYQGNIWELNAMQLPYIRMIENSIGADFYNLNSINPLKTALLYADMINAVSPTYAKEMAMANNEDIFFIGGNHLEGIVQMRAAQDRVTGILNGHEYRIKPTKKAFQEAIAKKEAARSEIANDFPEPDRMLLAFVGRAVDQKLRLLKEDYRSMPVLEHILNRGDINMVALGTGEMEHLLHQMVYERDGQTKRSNYNATIKFDSKIAERFNLACDLLLFPSRFEPCGIEQLKAMANATLPLVRRVGGLADTVDAESGYLFDGKNREELLNNLLTSVTIAQYMHKNHKDHIRDMQWKAFQKRFTWPDSAKKYIEMYKKVLAE